MGGGTGIIALAGTIAAGFLILSINRGLKMRDDGRPAIEFLWYAGGLIPVAGVFLLWISIGDQPMLAQRIVLGVIGAAMGACALIALGEVMRSNNPASAQSSPSREALASALDDLASAIAAAPSVVIGSQTTVRGGPGGGTVIGKQITVEAGPGSTGTIIGEQITASSSGTPVNAGKAEALREGARLVRTGSATRTTISALIAQSHLPGVNANVNAATDRANQALQNSNLPQ
jgi:hypothetical protein